MGTLAAALDWAKRGFSIFPLHQNSKEPVYTEWVAQATKDENTIRRMWVDPVLGIEHSYNIGCLCTDMVVVDIDVKEGKDGYNEYAQIGGGYDTLVVQTPTGGFHCYFYGPDSSNSPISKSVDIRSRNGFVVAPGSTIDGVAYTVVYDREMRWVPSSVERLLTPAYKRDENMQLDFEQDSEATIAMGVNYLQSCPAAIEGQRGDETTFKTAARLVNEIGLSLPTAYALMRDYYNPRCIPPWPLDELLHKVENATNYGTAIEGRLAPEVLFGQVSGKIVPPPTLFEQSCLDFGNARDGFTIPPRPWLVDRMLMRRNITLLLASGSAGKSTVSMSLAAHLAIGLDFAGNKAHTRCKTIIYNAEDDVYEQSRRLLAICAHESLNYNIIKSNLMLLSQEELRLDLVFKNGYTYEKNEAVIEQLISIASNPDVGLLVLDPLVKIHKVDESDNVAMDYVMDVLSYIARKADVAVLALHHSTKGNMRQEQRVGNMDIARGASAVVNAARIAYTLMGPTSEDAELYGFKEDELHKWVRLDDAKMNMSLASNKATWFKKDGVRIASGDTVGVVKYQEVHKSKEHMMNRVVDVVYKAFMATNSSTMGARELINVCKEEIPVWKTKREKDLREQLEGMFKFGHEYSGKTIEAVRGPDDKLFFRLT